MPPVVTRYLLLLLLGKNSFIGGAVYNLFGIRLTFSFAAIVAASMIVSLPLFVRSVRSAFALVNPAFEQASRILGANPLATFFRVSLPAAMPGVMDGCVLAFAKRLGEFGATITVAGNISGKTQTLALLIYSSMQEPGKESEVARLAAFSIVLSFMAIIVSELMQRKQTNDQT